MRDYKELISDLRDADQASWKRLSLDAAAAIDELQDEVFELEEVLNDADVAADDNIRQIEELAKRNAELHAELVRWVSAAEMAGEPKRGEWIETEEEEWGIYPFKKQTCSVCDCKIDHTFMLACMDYFDDRDTVFHYCPNCGAKMEVQE